ncbi:ornithine decarboxylase antizyme-domain-containing protein [Lenzites betulinus]|nr:ornithine decarboxylase antizyme-domain-containing protein [Lenzites betulinus]
MSNLNYINMSKQQSSIRPANGRQTVGDGAFTTDKTPSVIAVCHMEGTNSMYYYSTTFSGGPGSLSLPAIPHIGFEFFVSTLAHLLRYAIYSGGFDTPTAKCPPDRGSSDWVTDSLARASLPPLSSSPTSSIDSSDSATSTLSSLGSKPHLPTKFSTRSYPFPSTPPPEDSSLGLSPELPLVGLPNASAPRAIPAAQKPLPGIETPPLTPDDAPEEGDGSLSALGAKQSAFLSALFPRNALSAAPYAKSVSISTPEVGTTFEGVVLSLPGTPKTFYVDGKCAVNVNLRESIVALLDLADEQLECNALIIALERSSPVLGDLLHSLMYVGGTVVTKPVFPVDSAYVLVGMEI